MKSAYHWKLVYYTSMNNIIAASQKFWHYIVQIRPVENLRTRERTADCFMNYLHSWTKVRIIDELKLNKESTIRQKS